jgi:membrane associated rhomboid family serine protease
MSDDLKGESNKLRRSFLLPFLFVVLLWLIYIIDVTFHLDLARFGTRPREVSGLIGILTTPLLHANYEHIMSNSVPLLVLGTMVAYFYGKILGKLILMLYLLGGFWLWVLGTPDQIHIGASGLIYALVSFLFFSGIMSRHRGMMAVSLLTIFLYSSLALGIIPFLVAENISWQGHLAGSLAGIVSAFYFRGEGPKREEYRWEEDEEIENQSLGDAPPEITTSNDAISGVTYHFGKKTETEEEDKEDIN